MHAAVSEPTPRNSFSADQRGFMLIKQLVLGQRCLIKSPQKALKEPVAKCRSDLRPSAFIRGA